MLLPIKLLNSMMRVTRPATAPKQKPRPSSKINSSAFKQQLSLLNEPLKLIITVCNSIKSVSFAESICFKLHSVFSWPVSSRFIYADIICYNIKNCQNCYKPTIIPGTEQALSAANQALLIRRLFFFVHPPTARSNLCLPDAKYI